MKSALLKESKKNQSQPLYYRFNLLKPEITEKLKLIRDHKFQSGEISALLTQAERALVIIDENSTLKCFYHTHIANLISLLYKAYQITQNKGFEDTANNIKHSLTEIHPYLMENLEKLVDHSLVGLILKNFLKLKNIMAKSIKAENKNGWDKETYLNAEKKFEEMKIIFQPNQSLAIKIWDVVPLFHFFAYCVCRIYGQPEIFSPQPNELENNLFKSIQQLYHGYDKNEYFYCSYLQATHYHLLFLLNSSAQIKEFSQLYTEINLLEHENELYQFTKLSLTVRVLKPFRNHVFFIHKHQSFDQVNILLSILVDMHLNIIRIYEKIPHEFYHFNLKDKSNTYTDIVKETILTGILCSSKFLFEKEEHYRQQVENVLIKLDQFIKQNSDLNIFEKDINPILDGMTNFLQHQPVGTHIQWIVKYLKMYAIHLTPKVCSEKTIALRDFITHFKITNSEIKLIPYTPIQLITNSEQKFQLEYPNILKQFKIMEKQLTKVKSDNIEKFNKKSAVSLLDSQELIGIHKKRINDSINHSQPLSAPDLDKTIIFIYEVLSGLDCLKNIEDYSKRNEQISFIENLLGYFVNDPRIESLKLNVLHLQFLHYFYPKEIHLEHISQCIKKLTDAEFIDIFTHKAVIKNIYESSMSSFDTLNSVESQFHFRHFIFQLANKHIVLDLQLLNKMKTLKTKIDLVTDLIVDIITIACFLSSVCHPQAVKTNKHKNNDLQKRLLEKLISSILPYKNLIILNQNDLQIFETFNRIFSVKHYLPFIEQDSLMILLNFAKYFYDNSYCLGRFENLELAFAKLDCKDDHNDSKKITMHLSQSLKEKSDKIGSMKKQKCDFEEKQVTQRDQLKKKLIVIGDLENELQDSRTKEITLKQQFIQDQEELDKNHQRQLEQVRSQQAAELLAFKATQQIQEDSLQKNQAEAQATLAQRKSHLKEIQTQLTGCQTQIGLNGQTSVPDLKLQTLEKELEAAYHRIQDLENQLYNKTEELNQKSSLNQQKRNLINESFVFIESQKKEAKSLESAEKDLIPSLQRELKAIIDNTQADQTAHEKAFASLQTRREELEARMQTHWQPSFSFTPQTEMTSSAPSVIYYVPTSTLNFIS